MVRTQISLTEPQAALLKQLAADRSQSMSELIRRAIDATYRDTPSDAQALLDFARSTPHRSTLPPMPSHDDYLTSELDW